MAGPLPIDEPPSDAMSNVHLMDETAREIADALEQRGTELNARWLNRLREEFDVRAWDLLPAALLTERLPRVVLHIARAIRSDDDANTRELGDLVREVVLEHHRRGRSLEQLLVEVRVLSDLLREALRTELERRRDALGPVDAFEMAERLQRALSVLVAVVVGIYREAEADSRRDHAARAGEFARALTHELRNPLSAVQAAAQVLSELGERLPRERRRTISEQIFQRVRQANDLLNSVVSLTFIDGDPGGSVERRGSLRSVVDLTLSDLSDLAEQKNVRIVVPDDVPAVIVDANRVGLALYNLLSNAIKYADPEKAERWVQVGFERADDGHTWCVRVEDNGLGISPADRYRIFERFYRAHGEQAQGHGLGLSIVKEAIEQMGGTVECESEVGRGTTFLFTLRDPNVVGVA